MRIRSQKREGNKVFLEVEEGFSRFEEALKKTLAQIGREMNLPGFRPGKAPAELIERNINRQAMENETAQNLISEIYSQIIDEAKIEPVDYPKVEITQQQKDQPFVFKLEVEVYPEVKLGKYKGLKVEKTSPQVKEEEVLEALGSLQKRFKKGGQELPLDDEFAKAVSGLGTLAELKEEVKESLLKRKKIESEEDVKNKLITEVAKDTKVDLPKAMTEREIGIMLNELSTSLAESSLTLEDYLKSIKKEIDSLREEMRSAAEIRIKGKIVLHAIAQTEKMSVSPPEFEEEARVLSEATGQSLEDFKKNLGEGGKTYIQDYLLRRKALDFLVKNAKIKEKEASA